MRSRLLYLLLSFPLTGLTSLAPEGPSGGPWAPLIEPLPCSSALRARLRGWGAVDEVTRAASGLDSVEAYKSPTGRLGVWVTLERDRPRNRIRLFRTSSEETEQLDFGDDCAPAVTRLPRVVPEGYLTDHELEGLLQRHDSLVVYLWSPHLPLSVDGYREIEAATAALGVGLLAVVDPSSDPDFVKRAAEAAAIPESARRPLGSVELLFRDLAVHAPSILVFRAGDALAPLPGYRTEVGYRQYLRTALRRAD